MHAVRLAHSATIVMVCCCYSQIRAQDRPSATGLAEAWKSQLDHFNSVRFVVSHKTWATGGPFSARTLQEEGGYACWRAQEQWKITAKRDFTWTNSDGQFVRRYKDWEYVTPRKGSLFVSSRDQDKGKLNAAVAYLGNSDPERSGLHYLTDGRFLFGYSVATDSFVPDLMRASRLRVDAIGGDGSGWRVLLRDDGYTVTIEFNADSRPWPASVVYEKRGNDSRPVGNLAESKKIMTPGFRIEKTVHTIRDIEFSHIQNVKAPSAYVYEIRNDYSNGDFRLFQLHASVQEVEFGRDATDSRIFTVSRSIPNGTEIQVEDSPGLQFEWQDGQIVKTVPGIALSALSKKKGFGDSGRKRILFVVANVAAVLVLAMLLIYRRRRNEAEIRR